MIRRLSLFLLVIVAMVGGANIVCLAQPQSLLTRHVRDVTLNGQAPSVGRLPATQSMRIDIVLPVRDQAGLDSFLQELYDPSSPSYRHFLTVEQFTQRFGPSQEDYDAVIRFAKANGFTVAGGSRDAYGRAAQGLGGGHRDSLPRNHGSLSRSDREPRLLCTGPGAHGGPAFPSVAHFGFG